MTNFVRTRKYAVITASGLTYEVQHICKDNVLPLATTNSPIGMPLLSPPQPLSSGSLNAHRLYIKIKSYPVR